MSSASLVTVFQLRTVAGAGASFAPECGGQLGSTDAVGTMQIDLTCARPRILRGRSVAGPTCQRVRRSGAWLRNTTCNFVCVGHTAKKWIRLDHGGQLPRRADHDIDGQPEFARDGCLDLWARARPTSVPCCQDDVAALDVGRDLGVAQRLEQRAQLGHRDLLLPPTFTARSRATKVVTPSSCRGAGFDRAR